MKKFVLSLLPFGFFILLSACGNRQIATESPLLTPTNDAQDPCSSQNLPTTVQGVNDLMREFDDASQSVSNLSAQQIPDVVSKLQGIRRAAEDLQVPACLANLKAHELNHMNLTIQTLIAYLGGADQQSLKSGLEMARKEHDLYSLEIVRLLGITLAPFTATPSP